MAFFLFSFICATLSDVSAAAIVVEPDTVDVIDQSVSDTFEDVDSVAVDSTSEMDCSEIERLFADIPREVLPLIDRTARLDMMDLYNHGLLAEVENIYGGRSVLLSKTPDNLYLQASEASTWEMKVVGESFAPSDSITEGSLESGLIVCISTILASGQSSRVKVYDLDWREKSFVIPSPLRSAFYEIPDSFSPGEAARMKLVLESVPVWMSFLSTEHLFMQLSLDGLSIEDREKAEPLIKPIVYQVGERGFEPVD